MPGFFQAHLRPLAGSAGLHVALLALLAGAALHWRAEQPPVELAIEGFVTELPPARTAARPRSAVPTPKPVEVPPEPVEPVAEPPQERRAEEPAAAERAAQQQREQRQAEAQAAQQREAQLAQEREARQAREQAAAEQRRTEEAERRRVAEAEAADAKRRATEEQARKKAEAAETMRQAEAKAQAEREAAVSAERESELQRRLAAEEEAAAVARSGVVDEYRGLLVQTIERNWIRPPSARAGLECTLYVTQAPGGTVIDVRLGNCNGDQAVRESITNAVFRASPLPSPRDPRAFQRRLEIVFKPTE